MIRVGLERHPQALAEGTRLADAVEIGGGGVAASASLLYAGRRLGDGAVVEIVESWPQGAVRGEAGRCLPNAGQAAAFAEAQAAFATRLTALERLAAQGLMPPFERLDANGTLYALAPLDETPTLDGWSTDLLRRASRDELARMIQRVVAQLQAAHGAGLRHGAISQTTIRLTTPDDAHLADFLIPPAPGLSEHADMLGLAAALYAVVTGRPPPEPQPGFLPDPRHAASHIAADDYPPALLVAIDDVLGLGGPPKPQDAKAWLGRLRAAAADPADAATTAPIGASAKPAGTKADRPAAKPVPASVDAAEVERAGQRRLPLIAASALLLAATAVGVWALSSRDTAGPAPEPQPVVQAPATPQPSAEPPPPIAPPSAVAAAAPAQPEPASPPPPPLPAPSAPAMPAPVAPTAAAPDFASLVAAESDRARLLALATAGADPQNVAARLQELGHVAVSVGREWLWLKPGGGEVFRDCSECPELVVAPAGQVQMTLALAAGLRTFAVPVPTAFAIGRHEVTRGEFSAFVVGSGYVPGRGCHARAPQWQLDPALSWDNPGFAQTQDDPVVCISAQDARAYLAWLSRRSGQRYRLPSDAEWHYVALRQEAAGAARPEALCGIGNGADETAREANPGWAVAPCRDGYVHTAPVGRFAASDWGLADLNGNAWEWVETCAPGRADTVFPPPDCPPEAPRILRGGSFADPPPMRLLDARIVSQPDIRDQVAGFRVLREIGP